MLNISLHPYQEEATDAILARGNMLLAFDMGTGKTITSIAVAEELLGDGAIDCVLIVVPSGLKLQWASAIATRTDVATQLLNVKGETFEVPENKYCVVVDGPPEKRKQQYAMIKELRPQYVIVGYQTVTSDIRHIKRIKPGMIILDEATTIKNPAADVTKAVRKLWAPIRLALTGTPVDNRLEELWAVLWWVDREVLGDFEIFDRSFIERDHWGNVRSYRNLHILHKKIKSVVIRKRTTDPDVAPYMPALEHSKIHVSMDTATERVYREILKDLAVELAQLPARSNFDLHSHYTGDSENTAAGRVMAVHIAAQMLLTDPELLFESESRYAQRLRESGILEGLPPSAKFRRLEREVDALLGDPESKVIIVTKFRGMVRTLHDRWPDSVTYHGSMSPAQKQAAVNKFTNDPNVRVFCMSHAGAYGVDLPGATAHFNLDPARATGQRNQINARGVRAGSRAELVRVTDLITRGTIEEREYQRLDLRGRVAGAVVDGRGASPRGSIENTVESLTAHVTACLDDDSG